MTRISPKKSFGQNFLIDKKIVKEFVVASEIKASDTVLEVGAGTGTVTRELAKLAKKVVAVEFDKDLIPILENTLRDFRNVEIINKDILKFELRNLNFGSSHYKVVGSIPYQITSPLLHKLIIEEPKPKLSVLLIQKEVAWKIVSSPPKATYLANFVQTTFRTKIIKTVNKEAFLPQPRVEGAIVKFERKNKKESVNLENFSNFLHKGFSHPRKMLNKVFDKEDLKKANIDHTLRPGNLSFKEWVRIYDILKLKDAEIPATHRPIKSLG